MNLDLSKAINNIIYNNITDLNHYLSFIPKTQSRHWYMSNYLNTYSNTLRLYMFLLLFIYFYKTINIFNIIKVTSSNSFLITVCQTEDDDDWSFMVNFVHTVDEMVRATYKGNEAKSKMKHPSDMPMPRFEHRWSWVLQTEE